jgi:hypothetical protein
MGFFRCSSVTGTNEFEPGRKGAKELETGRNGAKELDSGRNGAKELETGRPYEFGTCVIVSSGVVE